MALEEIVTCPNIKSIHPNPGKWMLFGECGVDMEALWARVAEETASEHSAFVRAKISRRDPANKAIMVTIANLKDAAERGNAKARFVELGAAEEHLKWKSDEATQRGEYTHRDPLGRGGAMPACRHFQAWRCTKGAACPFRH